MLKKLLALLLLTAAISPIAFSDPPYVGYVPGVSVPMLGSFDTLAHLTSQFPAANYKGVTAYTQDSGLQISDGSSWASVGGSGGVTQTNTVALSNKTMSYSANTFTGFGQNVQCTNGSTGSADAALLAAAATVGGNITITGNCTVNATTTLNSNTTVDLNGYTITAAAAGNWSGSAIAAFVNAANNASYIAVQNGYLVWTGASGGVHIISFPSGNSHVRVSNIWSTGAGDLVATVGTTDALSQGNTCLNSLNACFDHWGGATDIKDIGNYASMVTTVGAACYQFTGFNTNGTISTTTGYTAIGNSCYYNTNVQIGININGFVGTCTQTSSSQVIVANNRVYVAAGIEGPGILLSGCGTYADVHDNYIQADGATTSSYPAVESQSSFTSVQMHNNIAQGWIAPTSGSDGGVFNNQGANGSIVNNQSLGTTSTLLVGGTIAATTQIAGNTFGTADFTVTGANSIAPFSATNTGNLGFNQAASFLAPSMSTGNNAATILGHDTGTGNGITQVFNYGGNNNGNSYWALEFNGTGIYWLKELYFPDTLYLGDTGTIVNLQGTATTGTFAATGLKVNGTSTGATTLGTANSSSTSYTATLPAATDTIVELAQTQSLSAKTLTSAAAGTPSIVGTNTAAAATVDGMSDLAPNLTSSEAYLRQFGTANATGNELQEIWNYGGSNNGNTNFQMKFAGYNVFFQQTLLNAMTLGDGGSTITLSAAAGGITLSNVTTGTNADFLCLSSGHVVLLQTSACTISSLRFKENVSPFAGNALTRLAKLDVDIYNLKATGNADPNATTTQVGLIAENIAQVFPQCAIYENDMKTPKSYRQECIIALLVRGEQELMQQNHLLQARLNRVEHPRQLQAKAH